jgi:hypothetical protein
MPSTVSNICLDAVDPARLADFWTGALGWVKDAADDGSEIWLEAPPGTAAPSATVTGLLLLRVPEVHAAKNRLHLDLRPDDQAAEVARLEALGARRVDIGQGADVTWVVMADPEGNEFCVLRAPRPDETE